MPFNSTEDGSPSQNLPSLQDHRPEASSRNLRRDLTWNVCWKPWDQRAPYRRRQGQMCCMWGNAYIHCMPSDKKCIHESTEEGPEIVQGCACSWNQKTHETAEPNHLERLLMTTLYSGVMERLFERFLQYLVSEDLIWEAASSPNPNPQSLKGLSVRGASNVIQNSITPPLHEPQRYRVLIVFLEYPLVCSFHQIISVDTI